MATEISRTPAEDPMPDLLTSLGTIKVPKSCDVLAEKLQQAILNGHYAPGAALPTERELVVASRNCAAFPDRSTRRRSPMWSCFSN